MQSPQVSSPRSLATAGLFLAVPMCMVANLLLARQLRVVLPPLTLACGRWAVAALLLAPFVEFRAVWHRLRPQLAWVLLLALLGTALTVGPQYAAASLTSPAHIGLIFASTPLLVPLIERLCWGRPVHPGFVAGVIIAFAGVSYAALAPVTAVPGAGSGLVGDGLSLVGALAWALYTALVRRRPLALDDQTALWVMSVVGAALLAPPAMAEWVFTGNRVGHQMGTPGAATLVQVVLLGFVASVMNYYLYGRLIARVGATAASTSMFLVPAYSMLITSLMMGEASPIEDWLSLTCIVVGLMLPSFCQGRGKVVAAC